ncbi:hypothetical protein FW778_17535 [Ginsengibacter hankyongi]|uniref:6-bladed beta-propeller protein n=1 Tax=Ginsengibacter hankyongi TaxID=2607284 RepID=A0A5J5IDA8_9BACT|nr:hypothetical protein [Ginsengibacter hankyongi]KAA9037229.1 hypothetical protein FW778_17535 [Ginsengibacter hankyongi]
MKTIFIFIIAGFSCLSSLAQEISYSKPERDDLLFDAPTRVPFGLTKSFHIIGKLNGNLLVYKNIRYKHLIAVYDNQMKLKSNANLDFLPSTIRSLDFVDCAGRVYVIYQFQKRNVFYCMAAAIDENGKTIREPFQLDTTHIKFIADIELYHIISSEDKSKIIIYKLYKGDVFTGNHLYDFTTLLFNDSLQLIRKSHIPSLFETENDLFSDFLVDNDGNFVFTKGSKLDPTDVFNELILVIKAPTQDNFNMHLLNLSGNLLDRVDLRVDNVNQQYVINALYFKKRNSDKEGPYSAIWSKQMNALVASNFFSFADAGPDKAASQKAATNTLDGFYLRDVILTNDGGFIVTAEDLETPAAFILPWGLRDNPIFYSSSYIFSSFRILASAYCKNVIIFYFDNKAHLRWTNEIVKSQYAGVTFPSFTVINAASKIYFLYNESVKQTQIMNEQTLAGDGTLSDKVPLRNLDFKYSMISRLGQQVSANEIVFPCIYRHYICFAEIKY